MSFLDIRANKSQDTKFLYIHCLSIGIILSYGIGNCDFLNAAARKSNVERS